PSFRPWRNAATTCAYDWGDALLRNPITGIVDCCARAVSGHPAAAPPKSVMNSRRRMRPPSDSGRGIVRLTLGSGKGKKPLCALLVDKGPTSQLGSFASL